MPDSSSPLTVRLSSGRSAKLHTQTQPNAGDLVLIEHNGLRQLAIHRRGRYLASSGQHGPQECRLLGVLRIKS